jgi:predicted kinase
MATAHLMFGYLGSGKTTLAKRLESEHRAVRFTPDAWMARLFGEDPPEATFADKAGAVLEMLEPLWTRCLALGVDVVLDYGFWRRAERDHVRGLVSSLGCRAILYRLASDDAVARRRVRMRNEAAGRSLFIDPATFDSPKARFEPLDPHEERVDV